MIHRRAEVAAATAGTVGLLALLLYLRTLAPTVATVDSGELTVAAKTLGVAHPPGTPLYVLLAHAATWLPFGTVATRVNVASALFAAVAAAATALIVFAAIPADPVPVAPQPGRKRRRAAAPASSPTVGTWMTMAASCMAGLLMAASRTLWAYATLAEVYTLNTMLVATAVFLIVLWRRRTLATAADAAPPHGLLYAAALVLGLALGVHHVTVGLTFPGLGLLVYATARRRPLGRRTLILGALCLLAGVSVYLYLPIAASRSPLIDWGDPRTLQRFWWHVTGRQYQAFLTFSLQTMVSELQGDFRRYLGHEFGPTWLPLAAGLAVVGWAWIWKRDRTLAVSFALIVIADLAYALNYDIPEDKDAYYLPLFLTLVVCAGLGAAWLLAWSARRPALARGTVAAVLCAAPVAAFAANLPYDNRGRYYIAHDYVTNILGTIAPHGLLLTSDWEVYSPMLYVRHIEGARPDATVIDVNLLRRSWYYAYLDREYPALMRAVEPQVDAFLVDLRAWEQDPDLYDRDVTLNERINTRFYDMIGAIVADELGAGRSVYVTEELLVLDRDFASQLARYQEVPQGLVFQVTTETGFVQPAAPHLLTRGLFDGTLRFEPENVVPVKIAPVYVSMLINRGRYLEAHGHPDEAAAAYSEARALDPRAGS